MAKQLERQDKRFPNATHSSRYQPSTPPGRRIGHPLSDSFPPIAKLHIPHQITDGPTSESPTDMSPSEWSGTREHRLEYLTVDSYSASDDQPGSVMPPQTRPVEVPPPIPATVTIPKNNRPKVTHLSFQEAKRWVDTKKNRSAIPLPGEELLARLGSRDVVSVDRESCVRKGTYTVPGLPD